MVEVVWSDPRPFTADGIEEASARGRSVVRLNASVALNLDLADDRTPGHSLLGKG